MTDGYPEEWELDRIRKWFKDWDAMLSFVKERWQYADCGFWQEPERGVYKIATGGWSGNEELISAMQQNRVFWMMCWHESKRGGSYLFNTTKGGNE